MPRLRFKNFSDLGFIQGIDKPRHLAPLLAPHSEYFGRQGIDVTKLKNDDASDRRVTLRVDLQREAVGVGRRLRALRDEGEGLLRSLQQGERRGHGQTFFLRGESRLPR